MHFQLLAGTHAHGVKSWSVKIERDDKGAVVSIEQPIIESETDLLAAFGPEKFRKLGEEEAKSLLAVRKARDTDVENLSPVARAAKEGAKEIAEPPGTDVTKKFPELQFQDAEEFPLKVYYQRGKGYYIVDDGELVTQEPLKREDVIAWVHSYRKG